MKWIPVLSKQTMFIYFILLFLLYLLYALNTCLVDEKKFSLKYHITNYRNYASLFGFGVDHDNGTEHENRRLQKSLVPVKRLPDVLIIGVKKCGTRALLESLRLHPDVRAASHEVHFFDKFFHKGFEWYRQRMPPTLEGQITMEKTPSYWVTHTAPRHVATMNPRVKLLVIVRDPVTRAISDYAQTASKRRGPMPRFEDLALMNSSVNWPGLTPAVDASYPPVRLGVYIRSLKRWMKWFPWTQMMVVNGEKMVTDPAAEMARVQEFLCLKPVITEKHFYFNSTKGFPCLLKSATNSSPHCFGKNKGRSHPHVDPIAIQTLRAFYEPYNKKFYKITGINFEWPSVT